VVTKKSTENSVVIIAAVVFFQHFAREYCRSKGVSIKKTTILAGISNIICLSTLSLKKQAENYAKFAKKLLLFTIWTIIITFLC
jgi:hypothetical protein